MNKNMKIIVVEDKIQLGRTTSQMILDFINSKPIPVLGLATGSTPESTYQFLVEDYQKNHTDWSHVISFNLDEYLGLTMDDKQSYRYFMNYKLFNHININKDNTFIPLSICDVESFANQYDQMILEKGGIDLQLLGIGENGHIGFNEPPADFESLTSIVDLVPSTIKANSRFFATIDQVPVKAISMGIKSILNAKKIILIANGENKAQAIKQLVDGKIDSTWPCTALRMHNDVIVIIDKKAASLLK